MTIIDSEVIVDKHSGRDGAGFRLRLTCTPIDHASYSLASDLTPESAARVKQILIDAFAQVVSMIHGATTAPTRRANDVITEGASTAQNP